MTMVDNTAERFDKLLGAMSRGEEKPLPDKEKPEPTKKKPTK